MSKTKITKPAALLLAAGVALFGLGALETTNALPNILGQTNEVQMHTQNVDVEISEITGLDAVEEAFFVDKEYPISVTITNSGIDAYVRASVTKYWTDADGNKMTDLDPSLIEITTGSGWTAGGDSTPERTIYYHQGIISAGSADQALLKSVKINGDLAQKIKTEDDKTVYAYNGMQLVIEVKADAIQTHHAADAVESVWGVDAGTAGVAE